MRATAKRLLSAAALCGILLPLGARYPGSTHAAASCAKSILLNASGWSSADQESVMVTHEIAMFEKANPCIQVYYRPVPANFQQKIQTEFASGDEPDVFYISPDMIYNEGKAGKLLDLTPYLAKNNVNLKDYIPSLLNTFKLNGKIYGLPKDWGTLGIFYNKAIFDAKKVPYPSNNLTYDQYRALALKLYTPNSNPSKVIYGTMNPEDPGRFNAILYGFGSGMMDPNTNAILFNNAKGIQALTYWTAFQLVDHSATIPGTVGDGWQGDSFGKGRVAMVLEGGWLTPYLRSTYPKIRFSVAQMPIGPAGRADPVYTNAWGASIDTVKNGTADAAAKLVAFLTGPVIQKYQTDIGFSLPTLSSLANDPYLKSHPEDYNLFNSFKDGVPGSYGAFTTPLNTAITNAITSVLLGKQTPAQAITSQAKTLASQITAIP